jgi:hypothetical protein
MKPLLVAGLCAVSAMLGATAGAWGGMSFDKRTGDLNGANMQMNEVASQLKLMAGLLFQLKQGDATTAEELIEQTIRSSRAAIEKNRADPRLTPPTLTRMDEAVGIAAVAEKEKRGK